VHVADKFVGDQRSRHAACGLHIAVPCAFGHLLHRPHVRYCCGGFRFKLFSERGPC